MISTRDHIICIITSTVFLGFNPFGMLSDIGLPSPPPKDMGTFLVGTLSIDHSVDNGHCFGILMSAVESRAQYNTLLGLGFPGSTSFLPTRLCSNPLSGNGLHTPFSVAQPLLYILTTPSSNGPFSVVYEVLQLPLLLSRRSPHAPPPPQQPTMTSPPMCSSSVA